MMKLQQRIIEKSKAAYKEEVRPPRVTSLRERGVTDPKKALPSNIQQEMVKMMPTNRFFQDFIQQHHQNIEAVIEKSYGTASHYGRTMHKANVSNEPPLRPFK